MCPGFNHNNDKRYYPHTDVDPPPPRWHVWRRYTKFTRYLKENEMTGTGADPYHAPRDVVDLVNHPPHYNSHPSGVQCIDITRHMTFDVGNAFKYVFRADLKGGRQDIDKARWYLEDALRHADPVFLPSWRFKHQQLLDRVVADETDPYRRAFFLSTTTGNVPQMLEAVNQILTDA